MAVLDIDAFFDIVQLYRQGTGDLCLLKVLQDNRKRYASSIA